MFATIPLHDRLQKALTELGHTTPTPVQTEAIPVALEGKDLAVSAETGSGKTAAFILPTLHRLLEQQAPNSGTRALFLAPTRELAQQIFKHCKQLTAFTHLKMGLITGGQDFKYQKALFRKNPEIIIGTPGRVLEHVEKGSTDFTALEVLVLDEADRMLDMGFLDDVMKIADSTNPERQTLLFSATLDNNAGLPVIMAKVLTEQVTLNLGTRREVNASITQQMILADDERHKNLLVLKLLQTETFYKAVVFTNTKAQANKLAGWLRYKDQSVGVLHGDMDQDARNQEMDRLRKGHIKVLVATDVASRGLDVNGVGLVINYDMAYDADDYIHRIGRTGRAGETGTAISLINAREWDQMIRVERYTNSNFQRRSLAGLEASFKGPKKIKSSGKAAGPKKSSDDKPKKEKVKGPKERHRDKKNIGKRRKPSTPKEVAASDAAAQAVPGTAAAQTNAPAPSARKKFGDEV